MDDETGPVVVDHERRGARRAAHALVDTGAVEQGLGGLRGRLTTGRVGLAGRRRRRAAAGDRERGRQPEPQPHAENTAHPVMRAHASFAFRSRRSVRIERWRAPVASRWCNRHARAPVTARDARPTRRPPRKPAEPSSARLRGNTGRPRTSREHEHPSLQGRAPGRRRDDGDLGAPAGPDRATDLLRAALGRVVAQLDAARPSWRGERVGIAIGTSSGGPQPTDRQRSSPPDRREVLRVEREGPRRPVLLQVGDRAGAGDGQHHRRAREEPRQGHLRRRRAVLPRDGGDRGVAADAPHREREERQVGDAARRAEIEHGLRRLDLGVGDPGEEAAAVAVGAVQVLHRHDGRARERRLDLAHADVAQPDVADLALALERDERVERLQERDARDRHEAEVNDVEALLAERAEIVLAALAELLGAEEGPPALVGPARAAELAGDDEIGRVGVERLGDQAVRDEGPVVPRRVDEVHAQLDGAPEHGARRRGIGGLAPHVRPRQAHGAVAEAANLEVAEAEGGGRMGEGLGGVGHGREYSQPFAP